MINPLAFFLPPRGALAQNSNEFGGDLRAALTGSLSEVRKILKKFPGIADPGADRILLFAGITPVAVPSNCTQVLVRVLHGPERENYDVNYREGQQALTTEVPATFDARTRAYLLVKHHGQETCKRTKPKCQECPLSSNCAFFAGQIRQRAGIAVVTSPFHSLTPIVDAQMPPGMSQFGASLTSVTI